jgi:hypothetical protein
VDRGAQPPARDRVSAASSAERATSHGAPAGSSAPHRVKVTYPG